MRIRMPWTRRRPAEPAPGAPAYYAHRNIVLHERRAIYFFVPKVACSSMKKICADLLGIDIDPAQGVERVHEVDFPSVPPDELARYGDYFKFAFVRNPWDRLVSCWSSKITGNPERTDAHVLRGVYRCLSGHPEFHAGMSFRAFAETVVSIPDDRADDHFRSQHRFVVAEDGTELCDFVGRFESLAGDLAMVLRRIGAADRVEVPTLNRSRRRDWSDYYTPELYRQVRRRYAEDLRRFGYTVEPRESNA